jgi:hypothetical protein
MPINTSSKPARAIPEWYVHVWKAKEVRDLVHRYYHQDVRSKSVKDQ